MAKETEDRINVAVNAKTYETFSKIARLLGKTLKDSAEEAVSEWNQRNAPAAQKEAKQLSKVAA